MGIYYYNQTFISGDVNNDSNLNIVDIIILIDIILGNYNGGVAPNSLVLTAADLNDDDIIDILDITSLINIILDIL